MALVAAVAPLVVKVTQFVASVEARRIPFQEFDCGVTEKVFVLEKVM